MAVFVLNNYNPIRTFEKNTIMSKDKKGVYTGINYRKRRRWKLFLRGIFIGLPIHREKFQSWGRNQYQIGN